MSGLAMCPPGRQCIGLSGCVSGSLSGQCVRLCVRQPVRSVCPVSVSGRVSGSLSGQCVRSCVRSCVRQPVRSVCPVVRRPACPPVRLGVRLSGGVQLPHALHCSLPAFLVVLLGKHTLTSRLFNRLQTRLKVTLVLLRTAS